MYSEVTVLAIRLPQSIEKRLEKLARRTGRTKTFYVREAILEHLDDLEDIYLAERVLERIRSGEEQTIPLEDALKRRPGGLNSPSRLTAISVSSTGRTESAS
jgi:RHH-type rel operon transcriptional repressor/antitoxin RelB